MLYLFNDFALDTDRRELRRGPNLVAVAPQAFDLLEYLIRHRERGAQPSPHGLGEHRRRVDAATITRVF